MENYVKRDLYRIISSNTGAQRPKYFHLAIQINQTTLTTVTSFSTVSSNVLSISFETQLCSMSMYDNPYCPEKNVTNMAALLILLSLKSDNQLKPPTWSSALLVKPPVSQLLKTFQTFYGNPRFVTEFTKARQWSTS